MTIAAVDFERLMQASQTGDGAAHRALLHHLSGRLRGYFRRQLTRSGFGADEAEDLVQDTLLAIHTKRHTYNGSAPVLAWSYGIARYKLLDFLRANGRARASLPIEAAEAMPAEDAYADVDTARELRQALQSLPRHFRLPIEYVKMEGLTISEAATRSGMSDAAVKVGIHRGMKKLAVLLAGARQ